jgi:hypothetical protein
MGAGSSILKDLKVCIGERHGAVDAEQYQDLIDEHDVRARPFYPGG